MPPWRSSCLSATVADWAGLPARPWAACSSTCQVLWGESLVLAGGVGQSVMSVMRACQEIWKRDGARPGGIAEDIEELGLWGD